MKKVPMPTSHKIANKIWTDVFNLRHNSDIKDVSCGLVAVSMRVLKKINWDSCPRGFGFDAWFKKECLRIARENNYNISQVPVDVNYFKSEVEAPFKVRFKKYSKMFVTVLKECVRA